MEIYTDGGVPIYNWAENLEAGAMQQAVNLSRLPFAIDHIAIMADGHQGFGMPIGGVLFADNAIVPYAIGVDIGCGVTLIETDIVGPLKEGAITALLEQIARDVPVGNGPQAEHRKPEGELFQTSIDYPDYIETILNAADKQLGTLGGGNHFLELQEEAWEGEKNGRIWFMLHSGSRSVGKKICDRHYKLALEWNTLEGMVLPHRELAYFHADTEAGNSYWNDMTVALEWAEENRRRMAGKVISALGKVFKAKAWQTLDIHHNYASWEEHYGVMGIVHRKGAVNAEAGKTVLIPGSMSTGSFVATGLGSAESFNTCQHGAGRARSRGDTRRMTTLTEMNKSLSDAGVQLVTPNRGDVVDESAIAYKDVFKVMAQSTDLITPTLQLKPLGVVKG